MAASGRGSRTSVVDLLRTEPERFELVQAVRLLERAAVISARDPRFVTPGHLGFDHDPRTEVLLLRAALELSFPVAEIAALDDSGRKPELSVTMLGLNGVSGVLPSFYSQVVIEANRDKNAAPRDFLDMFNHRALSLFVRAAHKYRLPLAYELGEGDESNTLRRCSPFHRGVGPAFVATPATRARMTHWFFIVATLAATCPPPARSNRCSPSISIAWLRSNSSRAGGELAGTRADTARRNARRGQLCDAGDATPSSALECGMCSLRSASGWGRSTTRISRGSCRMASR